MALPLARDSRWVFIGDSITDARRSQCPEGMGGGYVRFIRDWLLAAYPAAAPEILNRGISGNKITDLANRWKSDVLDLQPALVSIKIGINDVWHGLRPDREGTSLETYREVYHSLLVELREAYPKATVVLCEPSVIWPPAPEQGNAALQPYVQAVRELAEMFSVRALVPLHGAFNQAREKRPDIDWTYDGVHPGSAGHTLIARSWLAALGLL
jgi:acyl-CoA thioesterase-1